MTKRLFLTGTLSLAVLAGAQMNHGPHGAPATKTAPATPSTPSTMDHGSEDGALADLKGKAFDRAYLSMMIAHHQGAVDMSKAVVQGAKDAQVKRWTQDILKAQQQEITQMNIWLRGLGGLDKSLHDAMAKEMNSMVAALKKNKDSDRALVQGMLPHHASAISMANLALQNSDDARVLSLSRDIIRTQADEMYAYKQWLLKRGS